MNPPFVSDVAVGLLFSLLSPTPLIPCSHCVPLTFSPPPLPSLPPAPFVFFSLTYPSISAQPPSVSLPGSLPTLFLPALSSSSSDALPPGSFTPERQSPARAPLTSVASEAKPSLKVPSWYYQRTGAQDLTGIAPLISPIRNASVCASLVTGGSI